MSALDLLTEEQALDEPDSLSRSESPQPRVPFAELTLRDVDSTPFAPHPRPSLLSDDGSSTSEIHAPEIIISPCHALDSSPDMARGADLPSPPIQAESSLQGITRSSLRLQTPTMASYSNRVSVDLQSSFQLHFQSDTSFDLLNDKISLMEPMECFVTDDENFDFEVEKEKLRDALAKFKRGLTPSKINACMSLFSCLTFEFTFFYS